MDTDILIESKDLYDDFLDHLSKEYQWSSLLDAADASPSEILADAAPVLVPPFSPVLSVKSSPTESSNSDSGSEDDSKNSSTGTSERQSSQSPFDWMCSFDDEPPSNLNPEDVDQFLQTTAPVNPLQQDPLANKSISERHGPVMAIENGVIKGVGIDTNVSPKCLKIIQPHQNPTKLVNKQNVNCLLQNAQLNFVNENSQPKDDNRIVLNEQIRLVVEQKKVPSILKKCKVTKQSNIVIPAESTKDGKIAISPLPQMNGSRNFNGYQIKMSPPKNNIVISPKSIVKNEPISVVQNGTAQVSPGSPTNISGLNEAEIRAIKKQQRMIKNRESACQSRQKKKEYVTAIEQKLVEAHQEIARLQLENKLLRDQLESCGTRRKMPRLDTFSLIPKKNIAVIFAMIFMVSMNFNFIGWHSTPSVGPAAGPHRVQRHLLWSENSAEVDSPDYDQLTNRSALSTDCQNATSTNDVYMNQTESIRIVGDLNRWIKGGKTLNWTYDVPRRRRKVYLNEEKVNTNLIETYKLLNKINIDADLVDFPSTNRRNVKEKSRLRRLRRAKDLDFPENAVLDYDAFYNKPLRKSVDDFGVDDFGEWNALLQALHRRDDTFYVVGVGKGEHLLLPAVSHNDTKPPKMALILPARSGNDSLMNDHVTLMQIDCSVVNTTIVKLKSDALPESLRKKPIENVQGPKPENKRNTFLRRPRMSHSDDNLPGVLANSSNNVSNYPVKFKEKLKEDESKDDNMFAQYLISKYEESKNDSKSTKVTK